MLFIENEKGYSAKIVADSISPNGKRITTFELVYPRLVHSEMMTHRLFSRNAASSRAIPVKKLIDLVREKPARPYRFGANQPGMQDKGEDFTALIAAGYTAEEWWDLAALSAIRFAEEFAAAGYHKQIANRLLEPFQFIKTVLTATEFGNFWWLRIDADADPSIKAIAELMKEVFDKSTPELLQPGEWHTPYVSHIRVSVQAKKGEEATGTSVLKYVTEEGVELTLEEALAISSSCCAQVSYRVLNTLKEKAMDIYAKLISGAKVHASPFEHQGTPMKHAEYLDLLNYWMSQPTEEITQDTLVWELGTTHLDRKGYFWSGNFCGFIQHRQLLDNHTQW